MIEADAIRMRYEAVAGHPNERGLRLFAASEARAAGRGGIALVSQLTGIARSTIGRGFNENDGVTKASHPSALVLGAYLDAKLKGAGDRDAWLIAKAMAKRGWPSA